MSCICDLHRAVFDALDDGVSILDPDSGRVLEVNLAMLRMFGYAREEAQELTLERLCPASRPLSTAAALSWVRSLMAKGTQRCEWRARNKGGREFPIEAQLKSINLDGREHLLAIVRDLAAAKPSEPLEADRPCLVPDLRDTQRKAEIGALIGTIAHGLNNSLTPILGYASEARSMASDPAMAHCLDETLKACCKARDLASSLLTMNRPKDSGREAMYLWPAFESALQASRALLPPGVSMDVQGDASHIMAVASPGDVQELVLYLCTIALQALPDKRGYLAVRFEPLPHASGCSVSVIAEAFSIPAVLEFDARGRVLDAARELVKSLGGSLTLTPQADRLEISARLPGITGQVRAESGSRHHGHVLFIDDDKAITDLVCKQLSSAGYFVTAVSNSDEGLQRFSHAPGQFDCVVTDLLMPGLSGHALALRIRELRPEVPILLCSGNCGPDNLDEASAQCFAGYIPKPFSKRELTQAVSMALARTAAASAGRDKE